MVLLRKVCPSLQRLRSFMSGTPILKRQEAAAVRDSPPGIHPPRLTAGGDHGMLMESLNSSGMGRWWQEQTSLKNTIAPNIVVSEFREPQDVLRPHRHYILALERPPHPLALRHGRALHNSCAERALSRQSTQSHQMVFTCFFATASIPSTRLVTPRYCFQWRLPTAGHLRKIEEVACTIATFQQYPP